MPGRTRSRGTWRPITGCGSRRRRCTGTWRRAGLVTPQPRKRPRSSWTRFAAEQPNELWQSDFTHWPLAGGRDAEILAWIDDHSRYILSLTAHAPVTGQDVVGAFRAACAAHGAPAATLTGNGLVFTTRLLPSGGAGALEQELAALGVTRKNGKPDHPQTQGKVGRLQPDPQALARPPAPQPPAPRPPDPLGRFADEYNHRRPHRSLRPENPRRRLRRPPQGRPRPHATPAPSEPAASRPTAPSPTATTGAATTSPSAAATPEPPSWSWSRPGHPDRRRRHRRGPPRPHHRPHPRLPAHRRTTRPAKKPPRT